MHAAYCGSIRGKVAFLDRVSKLARNPTLMLPVTDAERRGCDVFDRRKYFVRSRAVGRRLRVSARERLVEHS